MNIFLLSKDLATMIEADPSATNPCLDAELIISHFLGKNREYVLAHGDEEVMPEAAERILEAGKKRSKGFPLAYLTGHKEFFGLDFLVNEKVLIPRPETELLVELAIKECGKETCIADVGTGSGCIIISLAKTLKEKAQFIALDISEEALLIAGENAERLGVADKIIFRRSDLLDYLNYHPAKSGKLIVSANLPYLTDKQIDSSPTIKFEPRGALEAGDGGFKEYMRLFGQIGKYMHSYSEIVILCEMDESQSSRMRLLAKRSLPAFSREIRKDYQGCDRFLKLKYPYKNFIQ